MWNDIKKFFATTNWKALLFAVGIQWIFSLMIWSFLFAGIIGWVVPHLVCMLVNMAVFIVAYVWFARRYPLRLR
jgi:hypothetical protein